VAEGALVVRPDEPDASEKKETTADDCGPLDSRRSVVDRAYPENDLKGVESETGGKKNQELLDAPHSDADCEEMDGRKLSGPVPSQATATP